MFNYKNKWQRTGQGIAEIRKRTFLVNILIIIALLFFIYLGYKDRIWSVLIVSLILFPFVLRNAYKYFFDVEYRCDVNKGHDEDKALPKEKRYLTQCYQTFIIDLKITAIALILYAIFGLCVFFNLI